MISFSVPSMGRKKHWEHWKDEATNLRAMVNANMKEYDKNHGEKKI